MHPFLEQFTPPELIVIEGNRPSAHLVATNDGPLIAISSGLIALCIRLAKYCVALTLPLAVDYMDEWPKDQTPENVRLQLQKNLAAFADSRGEVSQLKRIHISGLRQLQAVSLSQTFLRFALGHELAHWAQEVGLEPALDTDGLDEELTDEDVADILATTLIARDPDLDGDAALVEALGDLWPSLDASDLKRDARTAHRRGFHMSAHELQDQHWPESEQEFLAGVDLVGQGNWYATAIAAFIITVRGAIDEAAGVPLLHHVLALTEFVFGSEIELRLEHEMWDFGSMLSVLILNILSLRPK
jgi:hypothetical protein